MKLIVDIDDDLYTRLFDNGRNNAMDILRACVAIRKGKPLPKGHGRLIDEKDLSLMTVHLIDGLFVCDAPTIIEADKTESEANE